MIRICPSIHCFVAVTALFARGAGLNADDPLPATLATLRLANGDYVAGQLEDSSGGDTLRWQGAAFTTPFDFTLRAVRAVRFPAGGRQAKPEGEYCLELAGGDLLFGSLVGFTADEAVVDAPRLGRLHVRRASIQRLLRWRDGADLVYLGPNGLEDWEASSPDGSWTDEAGQLVTNREGASITSRFDVPVRASIEFELSWSLKPDFVFALAGSGASHRQAFRFEVWQGNLVLVREIDDQADLAWLGEIASGGGRANFRMYLDYDRGRAVVFSAAGEPLADLTVGGDQPAGTPRVLLVNKRGDVRLERLRIARWDGEPLRAVQADRSRIHLSDGAILYGQVSGFDPDTAQFVVTTGDGQKRVAADQVGSIVSAAADPSQPRTIRAVFQDGTRLSGELTKIEGGRIALRCPGITEPLSIPVAQLHTLLVLSMEAVTSSGDGRAGRLEADGVRLAGCLVDGKRRSGASCLVWQPLGSATASPLRAEVSGKVIYREPPPPRASQASTVAAPAPRPAGGFLGQLARALTGAAAPAAATAQASRFGPSLYLRTGDTIPCEVDRIDQRGVTFRSSVFDANFVPHDKIKALELENRSRGVKIDRAKRDRLLTLPRMQKNNPPTHLIRSTAGDYLRARLSAMDAETLTVEVRLEERALPRKHVSQIIWLHGDDLEPAEDAAEASPPPPVAQVQALRDDGIRLTFSAEEVADATLHGTSEVLGPCRVALADVDQLLIGAAIEQAATDLAYQRWRLTPAAEPRFVDSSSGPAARQPGTESALVGKPAPDFELELLDGRKFRLADHRDRIVVLDFWATWCGPCMQTMPQVDRVVRAFREQDVMLVAVNMQEAADAITAAMERLELETTVALDRDGVVAEKYAVTAIPQTVIIDRQGRVARLFVGGGPQLADPLREALDDLLRRDAGDGAGGPAREKGTFYFFDASRLADGRAWPCSV